MKAEFKECKLTVEKTARYFLDEPEGEVKVDLLAIHGYRQLGRNFIKRFDSLAEQGVRVIVPEGLHRFYVEGYSGKVGASWMTKEAREDDIEDYVKYLERLAETLGLGQRPLVLLGFSQGGPTACRWLASTDIPVSQLILHSSVFPNDFDFEGSQEKLGEIPAIAVFGDTDEFAPEDIISKKTDWVRSKGVVLELRRFKGGHEINQPLVLELLEGFLSER